MMDLNLWLKSLFCCIVLSNYSLLSKASTVITQLNHEVKLRATCGFPGVPKYGNVLHALEKYEEGMVVTYECEQDYYLLGSMTRTCLANGTWSGSVPLCDQAVKTLGLSSSSEALNNYPAHLAVDGNIRTCFFSNRRTPRWWRVELPKQSMLNQSIISVALTLPPLNADLHFSIYVIETEIDVSDKTADAVNNTEKVSASKYHKCATFRGVFSSKTIVVQCAQDAGGLRGNYLQIEDDHPQLEYFGLCQVDILVERQSYECGPVEIPANGYVVEKSDNRTRVSEYYCQEGFRLIGAQSRTCQTQTGKWSGSEPTCKHITCQPPPELTNGFYRIYGDHHDVPVVGTRTVYECRPGFLLAGTDDTITCDSNGEWFGAKPFCEAVDCGHPESLLMNLDDFMMSGAQFRMLNGTTKYTATAELICPPNQEMLRSNSSNNASVLFRCREDGIWTEITELTLNDTEKTTNKGSACVKQRYNGLLYYYGTSHRLSKLRQSIYLKDNSARMLQILAVVVVIAFLSILIIVVMLFKRGIIEWPDIACCSFDDRVKSMGLSAKQRVASLFDQMNSSIRYLFTCSGQSTENDQKLPSFTITPSSVSDIEVALSPDEANSTESNIITQHKEDLNTALATFYEEITNAAKQVFSEDTDRKLLRAARIAAELDAIKYKKQESNYHWIYATPPRPNGGSSSLPPSLNPSVHESSQIVSPGSAYARVDLIRKHRYRASREREPSVYQVPPRPQYMEIDPNNSFISKSSNGSTIYQLRKAISSPESVFIDNGEYATIRQYRIANNNVPQTTTNGQFITTGQQINQFPIQTLL